MAAEDQTILYSSTSVVREFSPVSSIGWIDSGRYRHDTSLMVDSLPSLDTLITLSALRLRSYTDDDLRDLERYFQPSAVLLTDVSNQTNRRRVTSALETPVVDASEPEIAELDHSTLVTAPRLEDARTLLDQRFETPVNVVSSFIEQEYDPNTFETRITGLAEYQELVADREEIMTHLTTTMDAGQPLMQAEIPLYGAGPIHSMDGPRVPCLTLGETPSVEELDSTKVGIQAIPDIGRKMRRQLERQGCTTREDILDLEPTDLLDLDGFGPYYVARVLSGAQAIEREEPLRFAPDPLADTRRIYVDIETDSLTPQYIWQIGVYDEARDQYHAFVNDNEPGEEASVVTEFAEWVATEATDGTFIAWYGNQFDFEHLDAFIDRHASDAHQEAWHEAEKFDLLLDFVKSGAATPARSHKLDVVADRLGYEREYPGLSGGQAAQAYAEWAAGGEMDWEMWISYCRDDVLAMKHVYDRISQADLYIDKRELEQAYRRSTEVSQLDDWGKGES